MVQFCSKIKVSSWLGKDKTSKEKLSKVFVFESTKDLFQNLPGFSARSSKEVVFSYRLFSALAL